MASNPLSLAAKDTASFLNFVEAIIEQYRNFIENNSGWDLLWNEKRSLQVKKSVDSSFSDTEEAKLRKDEEGDSLNEYGKLINESNSQELLDSGTLADSSSKEATDKDEVPAASEIRLPKKENAAQIAFVAVVRNYCRANNIDLTREANIGRGPVDFKFSSVYQDRALLEVKLASNSNLRKGLEKQLTTYLKAEQIKHGYYLIVFHYNKELEKINEVKKEVDSISSKLDLNLKVRVIDATLDKPSASTL